MCWVVATCCTVTLPGRRVVWSVTNGCRLHCVEYTDRETVRLDCNVSATCLSDKDTLFVWRTSGAHALARDTRDVWPASWRAVECDARPVISLSCCPRWRPCTTITISRWTEWLPASLTDWRNNLARPAGVVLLWQRCQSQRTNCPTDRPAGVSLLLLFLLPTAVHY